MTTESQIALTTVAAIGGPFFVIGLGLLFGAGGRSRRR